MEIRQENYKNEAERQRFENYEAMRKEFLDNGYQETEEVISVMKANVMAFVTAGPLAVLAIAIHMLVWGEGYVSLSPLNTFIFLLLVFAGVFIHEGLHGLGWSRYCKNRFKSIHIGMMWKTLTPYCHCKEPLGFGAYLFGGLLPLLVLGVGVSVAGIISGHMAVTMYGAFFILAAGGDTTIACYLLKHRNAYIVDHPKACGFIAYSK